MRGSLPGFQQMSVTWGPHGVVSGLSHSPSLSRTGPQGSALLHAADSGLGW